MKITLSTKPLVDALSLGIVNANVSKFFQRSCMAGLTIDYDSKSLVVNLEAASIYSKIFMQGGVKVDELDSNNSASIYVDSLLLKQLVSTLDSPTVTLDISNDGLRIVSGKSKFTLPKMLDDVDLQLRSPDESALQASGVDIDKTGWKYIKDYQMYAIAVSFIHPAFTKVWVGENGQVLVGDFDNSLFTYTNKGNLGQTCLLSDTIINLFNSLPDGAKLYRLEKHFVIHVKTDGYELISEFVPESDDVDDYHAEIILDMMRHDNRNAVKVNPAAMNKFLGQASLLSNSSEDTIKMIVRNDSIRLHDSNSDCSVPIQGDHSNLEYEIDFKTDFLKSVISHYVDEDEMYVCPTIQEGEVVGASFWNKELTTVLAGTD